MSYGDLGAEKAGGFAGRCVALAMEMLELPVQYICLDYDQEADVLYVSLHKPQRATDTVELSARMAKRSLVLRAHYD